MSHIIDETDRRILSVLQRDATISMDALSELVHLSRNACWRRVKQMEEAGILKARVALVDPDALGLGLSVFVMIRTASHEPHWLERFEAAVKALPEIIGAHRMSGDLDYVLRVRVASVKDYDRFYQRLIKRVPVAEISASFVMDDIKDTTALPT
ncbi:Lrp/AsnC family transcriptional regulator [Cognatishimia sp. MH4019]|uniref:Lrp/AsnC family transcriptional regulator n=1 Tax=Cognatishimia sp. MH4019 TaxID=2854030 RepID=UPI001CD56033|nr:Lrp/AsnC family transcriptional regulator [Cognatishimia sp. MH4019]